MGDEDDRSTPTLIPNFPNVTAVFAGKPSSFAISNGKVYAWGYDRDGMLGFGDDGENDYTVPTEITYFTTNNISINAIAASCDHTMALTNGGEVYSWGDGNDGQLGHGNEDDQNQPKKIEYFETNNISIKEIAIGESHSFALSTQGKVYSWGFNDALGLGDSISDKLEPTLITADKWPGNTLPNIKNIFAGGAHSHAIGSDGKVYAWGCNDHGQLGLNDQTNEKFYTPQEVSADKWPGGTLPPITEMSTKGPHLLAGSSFGNVFTWGYGNNGVLGIGNEYTKYAPQKVQQWKDINNNAITGIKISKIAAGALYGCGFNVVIALPPEESIEETESKQQNVEIITDLIYEKFPELTQLAFNNLSTKVRNALIEDIDSMLIFYGLSAEHIYTFVNFDERVQLIIVNHLMEEFSNLDISALLILKNKDFTRMKEGEIINFIKSLLPSTTTIAALSTANLKTKCSKTIKFKDNQQFILNQFNPLQSKIYNKLNVDMRTMLYMNKSALKNFQKLSNKEIVVFSKMTPIDQLKYTLNTFNITLVKRKMEPALTQLLGKNFGGKNFIFV